MDATNDKVNDGGATPEGRLPAEQWNSPITEMINLIIAAGLTPTDDNLNQIGKALRYYSSGAYYACTGVANAYALSTIGGLQTFSAYTNGMPISFLPIADNTSDCTVNVDGLGVVPLLDVGGVQISPGDLSTTSVYSALYVDGAFYLVSPRPDLSDYARVDADNTFSGNNTFYHINLVDGEPGISSDDSRNLLSTANDIINSGNSSTDDLHLHGKDRIRLSARDIQFYWYSGGDLELRSLYSVTPFSEGTFQINKNSGTIVFVNGGLGIESASWNPIENRVELTLDNLGFTSRNFTCILTAKKLSADTILSWEISAGLVLYLYSSSFNTVEDTSYVLYGTARGAV